MASLMSMFHKPINMNDGLDLSKEAMASERAQRAKRPRRGLFCEYSKSVILCSSFKKNRRGFFVKTVHRRRSENSRVPSTLQCG